MKTTLVYKATILLMVCLSGLVHTQVISAYPTSDLVWNYESVKFDFYHGQGNVCTSHDGYYFEGEEVIDGVGYSVFRMPDGTPYAYMRQDGPRVYVRNFMGRVEILHADETLIPEEEYQLYDFSKLPGERFSTVAFMEHSLASHCYGTAVEATVISTYIKDINGESYVYQEYGLIDGEPVSVSDNDPYCRNTVIEGIGPQRGMICAPQLGWWVISINHEFWYTSSVTTKDGEILWDDPSGVDTVRAASTSSPDSPIYDLHGRKVTNPVPGTIYLRDGRKFVAR